jgi:hypothetical protein
MKHWIKFLVTFVLAISIPLQVLAAVAMPVCSMSSTAMNANMVMTSAIMDDVMILNQPCDKECRECCVPQSSNQSKGTPGQKCFVCHLSAIQMPVALILVATSTIATKFPPLIDEQYQTFPPGLYRPPKSLSA